MSDTRPAMSTSGETPREVPVDPADRVRADIVNTRGELGDTVERLAEKLDVRAHAKRRLDDAAGLARRYSVHITTAVVTTLVAVVAMQVRRHTGNRFSKRRKG